MLIRIIFISLSTLIFPTQTFSQFITKDKALDDLKEFQLLLEKQSSYYQISEFDFEQAYLNTKRKLSQQDSIPIYVLAFELEKLISNIIDRHANIRMDDFEEDDYELFNLHLPFTVSYFQDKIYALNYNRSTKQYDYYNTAHPIVKEIDGINVKEFLKSNAYTRKLSPKRARQLDELKDLRDIGEFYFKQGRNSVKDIKITLTNEKSDTTLTLPLSERRNWYFELGSTSFNRKYRDFGRDEKFDLSTLDKWLPDSIAYLAIPSMESYEDIPDLEAYLMNTIEKYNDAKALIVDIRGNSGGTREILNTLSSYFVPVEQSPWVANVAYVRSDQFLDEDISSMQGRFLYNYNSDAFTESDREAIDSFNNIFQPKYFVDQNKFSKPFYMVLHSKNPISCPIYILVNEECFSAASVFASAFKGLNSLQIVGVTTNGSSGRSRKFYLKNSNIRVKLSTMLSFQRNGKTLDGNGTVPDIIIERDENQMLRKGDSQLQKLIDIINQ